MAVFMATIALSACAVGPSLESSSQTKSAHEVVREIQFVFRESGLAPLPGKEIDVVSFDDHGFYRFGRLLVKNSFHVFSKYNVNVVDARTISVRDTVIPRGIPILLVRANYGAFSRGNTSGATSSNLSYSVSLMDSSGVRNIWGAEINAKTFQMQSFSFAKNASYDDEYAKHFLELLANRMKNDGMI